ncbi:MAG: ISAs1 family transposase [Deltaproteobacteria bacterium]|nr:ISAs1 family transposase [Deltaproteobacteria bacterium]
MARPRKSKAQKEKEALSEFERLLRLVPDPRRPQGTRYPLESVIIIALMALVVGADDAESMQGWGEINADWLSGFLDLPHGVPTQDVFLSVFSALNPETFSEMFIAWMDLLRLRMNAAGKHIAVDGKTCRRSFDRAKGRSAVHTVSAWLSDAGLVLGQYKTAAKSNEITAIPELLRIIDIRGATITIDAMGCQTDIAKVIVEQGGDYILAVKENQPTLYADLKESFADALDTENRPVDNQPLQVESWSSVEKDHGRLEERTVHVCRDLSLVSSGRRWKKLSFIAMAEAKRTDLHTNETSVFQRYFIGSSESQPAKEVARLIRRHWSIENELHWVLDMAFHEDAARHRTGNCAQNFATLRHFALNLVKNCPGRRLGVANTRKLAGWDRGTLVNIFLASKF